MEKIIKSNRILPKEYINKIIQEHPEFCEIQEKESRIRIKKYFTKLNHIDMELSEMFLKYIGVAYYGYFTLLLQSSFYQDNSIDFNLLEKLGVSKSMINCKIRPKLKKYGIIKRYKGKWYVNPEVALLGQTVNPTLKSLFPDSLYKHIEKLENSRTL